MQNLPLGQHPEGVEVEGLLEGIFGVFMGLLNFEFLLGLAYSVEGFLSFSFSFGNVPEEGGVSEAEFFCGGEKVVIEG